MERQNAKGASTRQIDLMKEAGRNSKKGKGSTTTYPIRNDAGSGALRGFDVKNARPYERPPRLFVFILNGERRKRLKKGYETALSEWRDIPPQATSIPSIPYLVVMRVGRLHDANVLHPRIPQLRCGAHPRSAPPENQHAMPLPILREGRRGGQRAHEKGESAGGGGMELLE